MISLFIILVISHFGFGEGKTLVLIASVPFMFRNTCRIHHANMPCEADPIAPHFYLVKWWLTGVYIIFFHLLFCSKI